MVTLFFFTQKVVTFIQLNVKLLTFDMNICIILCIPYKKGNADTRRVRKLFS